MNQTQENQPNSSEPILAGQMAELLLKELAAVGYWKDGSLPVTVNQLETDSGEATR